MNKGYKNKQDIDVFILCGGRGKRLKRLWRDAPKPMIKIGNRPFLEIIFDYLASFGFRRFILGTGYKADFVEDYYHNHKRPGLKILFSRESRPLDTGGAIKKARRLIKTDPFMVLNGDSFCKFNPLLMLEFHRQKKSLISILLRKVSGGKDFGEVKINNSYCIIKFNEKDSQAEKCLINAGVYIFSKDIFKLMPSQSKFSLEKDFFPKLTGKKIFGYPCQGFFIDIGTPQRYAQAERYFLGKGYGRG